MRGGNAFVCMPVNVIAEGDYDFSSISKFKFVGLIHVTKAKFIMLIQTNFCLVPFSVYQFFYSTTYVYRRS